MSEIIREGNIEFEFRDDWRVCKLDDHDVYRGGLEKLEGSAAVDFVCCRPGRKLSFVEIKDYRGHGIESKKKFKSRLWKKMAQKVRDSVAVITGAHRRELRGPWDVFAKTMADKKHRLNAILWVETDPDYEMEKRQRSRGMNKLDRFLSWLNSKNAVVASDQPSMNQFGLDDFQLLGAERPHR